MKTFIICLAAIAAVSADVSHLLQGGNNGYNYPQPPHHEDHNHGTPTNNYLPPSPQPQPQPQQCPPGTFGQYPNCQGPAPPPRKSLINKF
ncbi:hypothetical protein Bhyg_14090 [Pseudolycoriella hygida]|uniref:Uncharacterized protein n=1 Tax=Pseudolycoriella hygida TaxID=35572 RepID=A0A9Q0MR90_9DIPT|nr:hypothetical protein Bhyg_14090 [Pseudolycoriella hygida]